MMDCEATNISDDATEALRAENNRLRRKILGLGILWVISLVVVACISSRTQGLPGKHHRSSEVSIEEQRIRDLVVDCVHTCDFNESDLDFVQDNEPWLSGSDIAFLYDEVFGL